MSLHPSSVFERGGPKSSRRVGRSGGGIKMAVATRGLTVSFYGRHLPRTRVWRSSGGLNMTLAVPFSMCRCCWLCQSARHRVFSTAFCSSNRSYILFPMRDTQMLQSSPNFLSRNGRQPGTAATMTCWGSSRMPPWRRSSRPSSASQRRSASEPNEDVRYWQQFHHSPSESFSGPEFERKRRQNRYIFGYCLLVIVGGLAAHYIGFRKLEKVHNNFMDEKDRVITQIYNESKERARSIGFQKQQELLRQKHAEFAQRNSAISKQVPGGALDSGRETAPPISTAK
ncbi:dnaJ homolog subfamily C member 4 isoform X2 [Podarcis raffonei]|uniref:dnaJ homolog subfamily C member 4 isoform X2 n=1 Tax=Podarcis raffonei TaxID=65483 RepID=UPI00232919F6|nr:dnaJ homolog subfamily C member 4 isoform X2 [Podarcis raffonei]